jgi:hypothetical protein
METVQFAITDSPYASALRDLLEHSGAAVVRCVGVADPMQAGVIVVDSDGLDRLLSPLLHPERVVLIARGDSEELALAWNTGIRSVVFNEDPLETAVLAILAAGLRVPRAGARCEGLVGAESEVGSARTRGCRCERPRRDG